MPSRMGNSSTPTTPSPLERRCCDDLLECDRNGLVLCMAHGSQVKGNSYQIQELTSRTMRWRILHTVAAALLASTVTASHVHDHGLCRGKDRHPPRRTGHSLDPARGARRDCLAPGASAARQAPPQGQPERLQLDVCAWNTPSTAGGCSTTPRTTRGMPLASLPVVGGDLQRNLQLQYKLEAGNWWLAVNGRLAGIMQTRVMGRRRIFAIFSSRARTTTTATNGSQGVVGG